MSMSSGSSEQIRKLEDLDPGFLRQRRNLLSISAGLIILQLSGGEIQKASMFFGVISIERAFVLEASIWVFLIYSLWRYWLYREDPQDRVKKTLLNYICSDKSITKVLEKSSKKESRNMFSNNNPILIRDGLSFYLDLSRSYKVEKNATLERKYTESTYATDKRVNISFLNGIYIKIKIFLIAALRERSISDYYLPYAMTFGAVSLGLSSLIVCA